MDRSLRLLMALRTKAAFRGWLRSLRKPQGIILTLILGLMFVPWFVAMAFGLLPMPTARIDEIARHGPVALLALTLALVVFSAGEQSLYYMPSEVDFLFAGPYHQRQLVAYKLVTALILVALTSLMMAASVRMLSPSLLAGFLGSFLFLAFVQLLQIVIGLGLAAAGALAWNRGRQFFLAAVLLLIGLGFASVGQRLLALGPLGALRAIEESWPGRALLAPFVPFVGAFTARGLGALAGWAAAGVAIDGVLVAIIFGLDAGYLEAASAASARRFAKVQRMIGGGGGLRATARQTGRFAFKPPETPWWGGIGPNVWRQATMALGSPGRLLLVGVLLAGIPPIFAGLDAAKPMPGMNVLYFSMGMVFYLSFLLTGLLPYDFRGDVDMMEELKALPISPTRIAIGQILTPIAVTTAMQAGGLLVALLIAPDPGPLAWTALLFLAPINLILFAVENVLYLWYPSRMVAGQVDATAVGRQMMLTLGKLLAVGLGVGLAVGAGGLAYYLTGGSRAATATAAWTMLAGLGAALVPLVGVAFDRFDVARDVPA